MIAWLGLLGQQFSTIRLVRLGEMSPSEVLLGWSFLGVVSVAVALLAFRPYVAVAGDVVVIQGPLRRFSFGRAEVVEVGPTAWGLRFVLRDGTARTSIVCQSTRSFAEPRWFDVVEAVTGARPSGETWNEY